MLYFKFAKFQIEISNQLNHSCGSVDNVRRFDRETYLGTDGHVSSQHAVVLKRDEEDEEEIASHLFAAHGGASGIHEHSAVIHNNRLLLAVGNRLCALEIPSLDVVWKTKVDMVTCFGVHLPPRCDCLISHGELDISHLDFDGKIEWQSGGADIFTGDFEIFENHIEAEDWNGQRYHFDIKNGKSERI
jgi:hypothetical protein